MLNPRVLTALSAVLFSSPLFAYNYPEHDRFALDAAAAVCAGEGSAPFCAELKENLAFFRHGSVMEDLAAKGHKEFFNGVEFKDEEAGQEYGPCRKYVVAGETFMYCNHYFFLDSYLAGGEEGSCGSSMLGATSPRCDGNSFFRWESARQRGLRLWKEKVIPNYYGGKPDSGARAYYWLGRVAHLLGDVSVPAHLIPHKLDSMEFEHRVYEYEAGRLEAGPPPRLELPDDLSGLFTGLAGRTLSVHAEVRSEECRRDPGVAGCDERRASPSKPLESRFPFKNLKLINDLMNSRQEAVSKPEILRERELARRQLVVIKPLAAAYIAKLLEIFGARTGLAPRDTPPPAPLPEGGPVLRLLPAFEGARDFGPMAPWAEVP